MATREEDDTLKDILVLSDIAYYGNNTPHARTIRKLMAKMKLTPLLRGLLLRLVEQPPRAIAKVVRTSIDA